MFIKPSPPFLAGLSLLLSTITLAGTHDKVPNVYLAAPCPSNAPQTYLSVTNAVILAPIDEVWVYTGDFFNIIWQNLTVTSTTGVDDEPGARRTFSYGFNVTETLLEYVDTPQIKYYKYGFSLYNSAPATIEGALFTDIVNLMKVTNVTAGTDPGKTTFEYTQRGCADDRDSGVLFRAGVYNADLEAVVDHFS